MDEKESALKALKLALNTNRWSVDGSKVTIIPTELAVKLYNLLSDDEKLIIESN